MSRALKWRRGSLAHPRLSYLEIGPPDGPLVLALHGFPDVPGTFRDLASRLAERGYRCVLPWMRGYAPSTVRGPFGPETIASDVLLLADTLSPREPVSLMGHDWGAVAVYGALARAPWRFKSAITMAVPHPSQFLRGLLRDPAQLYRSRYMFWFQCIGLSDRSVRMNDFAYIRTLYRRWSPGWSPPPAHLEEVKSCLDASLPGPLDYYRALGIHGGWTRLASLRRGAWSAPIPVPTLYLHGSRDGVISREVGVGQERMFVGRFRSETISDAGHWLHLEKPEETWRHVSGWLASGRDVLR